MRSAGSIIDLTISPTPSPIKRAPKYGVSALDANLERAINLASVEALKSIVVNMCRAFPEVQYHVSRRLLTNGGSALEKPRNRL
jgi:hypothetical protein